MKAITLSKKENVFVNLLKYVSMKNLLSLLVSDGAETFDGKKVSTSDCRRMGGVCLQRFNCIGNIYMYVATPCFGFLPSMMLILFVWLQTVQADIERGQQSTFK